MISHGMFSVRCDGIDHSTGDKCKSSVVLTLGLDDLAVLPRNSSIFERATFFGARIPAWSVTKEGRNFCPNCKP